LKSLKTYSYLLILVLFTGCASTFNPSNQEVVFNSKPRGMSVIINDSLYGKTPIIAGLTVQKDFQVKFKFLDSVVFTEKINHWVGDSYKTYIYFNLYKNDTNLKTNIDIESLDKFKQNVLRKYSFDWSIMLNNYIVYEKLKLLKIENNQLKFSFKDSSEIDFKKYVSQKSKNTAIFSVPIDSINKIVNFKKIPFSERMKTAFITTLLGSLVGYGIDNYIAPKPNNKYSSYYNNQSSYSGAVFGGFLGFIIGIIKSTKDYHTYKLTDMNNEERIQFINKEILLNDE
jgi:hypothetical protein